MSDFTHLLDCARQQPGKIVLAEGEDPRVIAAARQAVDVGTARPILLGNTVNIQQQASKLNLKLDDIQLLDPAKSPQREQLQSELLRLRAAKGMTETKASLAIADNLHFACMMVQQDLADGCVAGARYPTADVVRSAIQLIGKRPNIDFVSSFFIMLMTKGFHPVKDIAIFADCALVINPDANQLAQIAITTGTSAQQLLGMSPQIAMLSFSTAGSAKHACVSKVTQATALAQTQRPDWRIVGEVQLDAAVVPAILQSKAPNSATDEPLNIFVFPNLDAGNIGYKMCERFGGAEAIGPVLQGLVKPVNDLSRGCNAQDIANIIAVTTTQAQNLVKNLD